MVVGAPREALHHEHRVGLTPFAATRLVQAGAEVLVERDAGRESRFVDADYERAGARIVYDTEEIYGRCDVVCRVGILDVSEIKLLKPESVVCGFQHLAVQPRDSLDRLAELGTTLIGYEIIHDQEDELAVLMPMSELAGQQAVHVAANLLQNESGGRGILLGAAPAIPPPTVLVLGAGAVGSAAARCAIAVGAHVIVLDPNLERLERVHRETGGRAVTVLSGTGRLEQYTSIADVVIGAVLVPGARTPFVVTEDMVRCMKQGSVIVDVAIDQGGCVETSRPTSASHPFYSTHGVLHYCVPNMTANVGRTASRALANGALPYLETMVQKGVERALRDDPGLAAGVYMYRGKLVNEATAASFGLSAEPLVAAMERRVMRWLADYSTKAVSAAEAVARVESGMRVYYGGNAAIPTALVDALAERRDELQNVQLNHVLLLGEDPLSAPGMEGHFRHNSLFVGPADRAAVNDGRADYVPIFLHHIPRLFRTGSIPLDVAMVQVSPPDEHGFMSLGVENLASKAACETAKCVIVQVNENMPRVLGDSFIHVGRVQAIVEHTVPLPTLQPRVATDVEKAIADHILPLIEPGSTIQMGIGGIPDSVFAALDGDLQLGIHTEMLSDGAMKAIERGVVTGGRKTLHPGKTVITFALGTTELYDFLDNNPFLESHPAEYVNDPQVVSRNDNMVAINSAIELDLTGQVCSDSMGPYIYSGFGGQVDFIRGAAASKGGRPIIALPSTAKKGTQTRIVPFLKEGAGVVTSRADVNWVVTEHGAVSLFGKNLRERAEALIGIAEPEFRDELERAAKERKLLP